MKKIAILIIFICGLNKAYSQNDTINTLTTKLTAPKDTSYWKLSGSSSFNFLQSSYNNWASGGENAVAGAAGGSLMLKYEKNKAYWENTLDLAYGLTYRGSDRSKNDDKIDYASKYNYKAFSNWNYSTILSFKSQMDRGYDKYPVVDSVMYNAKFLAPAYLQVAIGMDYTPKLDGDQTFSFMISPLSGRLTIVNDDYLSSKGAYGVHVGDKILRDYGAFSKTVYTKKIKQNIALKTSLNLFSSLLEHVGNVDVDWELSVDMKVTKFISSKFGMQIKYDDDVKTNGGNDGAKAQIRQVLGVGFSYIF